MRTEPAISADSQIDLEVEMGTEELTDLDFMIANEIGDIHGPTIDAILALTRATGERILDGNGEYGPLDDKKRAIMVLGIVALAHNINGMVDLAKATGHLK